MNASPPTDRPAGPARRSPRRPGDRFLWRRGLGRGWALLTLLLGAPVAAATLARPEGAPVLTGVATDRVDRSVPQPLPQAQAMPGPGAALNGPPPPSLAPAPRAPAAAPGARAAVPGAAPGAPAPLDDAAFAAALRDGDLDRLYALCRQTVAEDRRDRLRQLQGRLLVIHPAPQPLAVVLANAEALLGCLAPTGALTVLNRIGPAAGPERIQWLVVQWRAASAALDHRRAALALQRLAQALGPAPGLETLALPMRRRDDGTVPTRPALDELAEHLAARGLTQEAAQLLLASRLAGAAGADRLRLAAGWGTNLSLAQRETLLERALDQAAAAGAWGLVNDLLDDQLALPAARARERRLRLAPRLDDAYGEWLLRQGDPASAARARELEGLLRSPRRPGGHSVALPDPLAPSDSGDGQGGAPEPGGTDAGGAEAGGAEAGGGDAATDAGLPPSAGSRRAPSPRTLPSQDAVPPTPASPQPFPAP